MRSLVFIMLMTGAVLFIQSCASTDPQRGNYEKLDLFHQQKQVR